MLWAFIILIAIITCFLIPRFGVTVLVGGLIVGGILLLIILIYYVGSKYEESEARKRISRNEIQLMDLRLMPEYGEGSFKLSGRIKNNSKRHTLDDLRLKIIMRDCIEPENCEIVGEDTAWFYNDVPPEQVRQLDANVHFSKLPRFKGNMKWTYSFEEIKGK